MGDVETTLKNQKTLKELLLSGLGATPESTFWVRHPEHGLLGIKYRAIASTKEREEITEESSKCLDLHGGKFPLFDGLTRDDAATLPYIERLCLEPTFNREEAVALIKNTLRAATSELFFAMQQLSGLGNQQLLALEAGLNGNTFPASPDLPLHEVPEEVAV